MSERAAAAGESRGSRAPTGVGVPGLPVAGALMVALAVAFWLAGLFEPDEIPDYASSSRQITGMALMLILVPSYIIAAASLAQRRSLALVEEVRPRLADPREADAASEAIRGGLRRYWPYGLVLGVVLGFMNTQPLEIPESNVPAIEGAISAGQLVMWCVIGQLFCVRLTSARAFRRLGEGIALDLLRPERQRPVARSGVIDVMIIAGAMLMTPLQSLDAEFRWYNYHFGLLVSVPSAVFFVLWPLLPLHRRSRADRDARLAALDRQIQDLGASPPATPEAAARLEALLAHRDRIRTAPTWPLGTALVSRVLLYLVIPPLAWAAAALVERGVDRVLGG